MDRQLPITFNNAEGHRLFGILHEPITSPPRDIAIILLSPGVKSRVAPHRLYNTMARAYVELGFRVLRFDFHGLGDSEGAIAEPLLADLYRSIQIGRYVDDTRSAMAWMRRTCGVERFILGGLCGGAITGVLAGADDPEVVGILGLGLPVILDGSNVDKVQQMTAGQLAGVRQRYLRKLLDTSAWLRLLTLQSDLRLVWRALSPSSGRQKATAPRSPLTSTLSPPPAPSNANPRFPPAFLRMLAGRRPVLLLFSGADRLYAEFEEKFLHYYRESVQALDEAFDLVVVENANHVFTLTEWQQEMLRQTRSWLLARFPNEASPGLRAAAGTPEQLTI